MRVSVRRVFNTAVLILVIVVTGAAILRALKERIFPPEVVIQVLVSDKTITVAPDRAQVGQRVRFGMDATDNAMHHIVLEGTPVQAWVFYRYITRQVDWIPTRPGAYLFRDTEPGQTLTGTFTVEPFGAASGRSS